MTKTIILLDDYLDEQLILRDAFNAIGIAVTLIQVLRSEGLWRDLEQRDVLPDLLLLDINLPDDTGLQVIRRLQEHPIYCRMPIVMYTNAGDLATIDESFTLGASVYLRKTTSFDHLTRHLRTVMDWNLQEVFNLPVNSRTLLN